LEPVSESDIQQEIQIAGPRYQCILERNNCGALKDKDGRYIRFGLGNVSKKHQDKIKSSDLIGAREVMITPEMVGKILLVFTAVEVKAPDWKFKGNSREVAQSNYLNWVKSRGGFAGFAKSVEEFKNIIRI
jgi:hypothetical protein